MENKKKYIALILFGALFVFFYFTRDKKKDHTYFRNEGTVFGTLYHISYEYDKDLHDELKAELKSFDNSLSTFNKESVISKVNQNEIDSVDDEWFLNVFRKGNEVSQKTEGAFDMTVAPLVNLWGFGFKKYEGVTRSSIDSIMEFVGYDKIRIENSKIEKSDLRVMIDASAIAKGYASDILADYLKSKGIINYMVEIGGEVALNGKNSRGDCWRIGINKPIEDNTASAGEIQQIVSLCEGGMATSGNYRNFYYKDGKRYAHTIDPRSGYPVEHSLLSATVIAPTCMIADAYATAFMVLGPEKSMAIIEKDPELEAYFILSGKNDKYEIIESSGFEKFAVKKR